MAKLQRSLLPGKWAAVLCAGLLLLAAVAAGLLIGSSRFPRLEVGDQRITREEYLSAMYRARNQVLSDHAAAGLSLKDWHRETALGDPCRLTMERTLELLSEYYAVSTLAVERGYLTDAGYEAMVRDMEQINEQRREELESGGIVTGFPQFTPEDYAAYRASSLRLQFCSDPGNPENQVTDQALLERYEADRENLYRQPDSMELAFLMTDGGDDALEQTFRKARETGSLAAALAAYPELESCYQEISVNPGTYSIFARSHGDVLTWAADLQPGELSQVIRQEDRLCLIECRSRTEHQYAPLEDVQTLVAQSIRESRYDALIAERMASWEITVDLPALYRFTAEQLP